jgi:hypothetical protein
MHLTGGKLLRIKCRLNSCEADGEYRILTNKTLCDLYWPHNISDIIKTDIAGWTCSSDERRQEHKLN